MRTGSICLLVALVVPLFFTPRFAAAQAQDAPATPAAAAGPASATIANVEVTVESAYVDYIALKGRNPGVQGGTSDGKVLIIKIKLYNKSDATVTYHSYNGVKGNHKPDHASVTDGARKFVALVDFDKYEPTDSLDDAQIGAGQTITDVMAFAVPPSTDGHFTIFLPQANLGGTAPKPGYIMFTISGQ